MSAKGDIIKVARHKKIGSPMGVFRRLVFAPSAGVLCTLQLCPGVPDTAQPLDPRGEDVFADIARMLTAWLEEAGVERED
jgi:hypothetical protein